ncbi:DUF2790 domain-containing protein [Azomonas macrocytogenes]|uniref:DUF2790 domain-containing protein n=1 Tax=Azomonas macrocytogenes TaxID=69962 RepID=A0A839T5F6_AZOMA|nr:DUF2790 domain-containing protein [Azomonas macrocytogenes]MBB3104010.1 hypothetical protein [Azomonas macrocytogenes]
MKRLIFLLLAILPGLALADSTLPAIQIPYDTPSVKSEQYEYGMKLDIHRVISRQYGSNYMSSCDVVPAHMVYDDSQGQRHAITYKVVDMDNRCN